MGLFGRTKQLTSDEHNDLIAKLTKIAQDVSILNIRMDTLETRQNSLRGLVNRKGLKDIGEDEELNLHNPQDIQRYILGFQNGKD